MSDIKKVVLAYSGGLDTSVILKWLQDSYGCEVVTFMAYILSSGYAEEMGMIRKQRRHILGVTGSVNTPETTDATDTR